MGAEFTPQRLAELADVDLSDLADGDTLVYDADSGKFIAGSAGGSLPEQWTVGAEGSLDIDPDDGDDVVTLTLGQADGADCRALRIKNVAGDTVMLEAATDGDGNFGFTFLDTAFIEALGFYLNGDGSFYVRTESDLTWGARPQSDGVPREFFRNTAAPDDGDVVAGERIQWYEATSGAVKFGIKQRDSDGTLFERIAASYTADGTAFVGIEQQTLDPATVSAEDIANALIALGLAASP